MTLRVYAKVLLQVWSYDFSGMTVFTKKQRRRMVKYFKPQDYLDCDDIITLVYTQRYVYI